MLRTPLNGPATAAQGGFTLVEMLIAMLCATVVVFVLAVIMQVTLEQSARISDATTADQIGRGAMTQIVEELHSSCTGFGATAIQVPSGTVSAPLSKLNGSNLWFVTAYGPETGSSEAFYKKVYEHDVVWEKTQEVSGLKLGTLVDYRFTSTGEPTSGVWPFPALETKNASKTVLAENVVYPSSGSLFTYYQFAYEGSVTKYKALSTESEIQTAAGEKEAGIAKVEIQFTQAPPTDATSGKPVPVIAEGHTVPLRDTVILRFNVSEPGTEGIDSPCK